MSMLAERKVKQKWSLNPRGSAWSEDSNKFGQKMLEKMGWSKGKGLGARENGIVEHVKISYKNDSKGMGFKETNNQWTEHDTHFNALLQSLSGAAPLETDLKISSLEKKSQTSKVRVHYRKFTRGKDLSRCSEKDLANIFGKKTLKEKQPPMEEIVEEKEQSNEEQNDRFVYNGGSMLDYFKKKLPNFGKNNGYVVGSNGVLKRESDSEEESRVGFGFEKKRKANGEVPNGTPKKKKKEEEEGGLKNPGFDPLFNNVVVKKHILNTIEEETEDQNASFEAQEDSVMKKKKKRKKDMIDTSEGAISEPSQIEHSESEASSDSGKKKKKKNDVCVDNPNFDENAEDSTSAATNDNFEVTRKKKKKKDKSASAIENPNFDISDTSNNASVNETVEVKRKKKKKNGIENPNFDNPNDSQDSHYNNDFEVKRKKKKSLDESTAIDNPNFDSSHDCQDSYVDSNFEVKRKKKKSQNDSLALDNRNFDSSHDCQDSYVDSNFEVKRKKKKCLDESLAIDNPNFDSSRDCQDSYVDSNFEVKRKKKKSQNDSLAIDNPNFDSSHDCQDSYVDSNFEVKRKKKKVALDNPTFEDSLEEKPSKNEEPEEPSFDLILNVTNTPPVPKPPKKQSSVKRRKSVRFSDVNEERIIPSIEDLENRNELFDINSRIIENGLKDSTNLDLDEISKKLDCCQAEVENDINEARAVRYVGEVGDPNGENEKLPEGTKLKFRFANFGRSSPYFNRTISRAKTSYKHLIKGDIILGFNNTNLHEIVGYGVNK